MLSKWSGRVKSRGVTELERDLARHWDVAALGLRPAMVCDKIRANCYPSSNFG
jgi:hypothetical protein